MNKDIIEIINDNVTFLEYYEKQRKEIERLNNIINKFENSLTESNKYINNPAFRELFREQLEYLQELKGEDKE